MDSENTNTLTACPHCGATGSFQWCGDVWAVRPVGEISFNSDGDPVFESTGNPRSDFEQGDRYQSEVLECRECFARIATRQEGNEHWALGGDFGLSLGMELEKLCKDLVAAQAAGELAEGVLDELATRARGLLALAGVELTEAVA